MRTVVDGYNLAWAIRELRDLMKAKRSDAARNGLVVLLADLVRAGRLKTPVSVVFDGRPEAVEPREPGVEVRFAPHSGDADRLIADIVADGAVMDELLVVTSDRELQERVRRLGAKVIGVRRFIEDYAPPKKQRSPSLPEETLREAEKPSTRLSAPEVDQWLAEFGLEDD